MRAELTGPASARAGRSTARRARGARSILVGRPSLPTSQQRRATALLLSVAIVGIELIVGLAIVDQRFTRLLAPLLGAIALALVFRFPLAACCAALVLTNSIFNSGGPGVELGSIKVGLHELILAALLLVALVKPRRRTVGGPAGVALAAFLGLVAVSAAAAVSAGQTDLSTALSWARDFGMLAFFFVVVRLCPEPRALRRLLGFAAGLAALIGLVAVLVALGAGFGAQLQDPAGTVIRADEGVGGIARVRLPGLALAYVLFWVALTKLARAPSGRRAPWAAAAAGMAASIAVSFNRNMWVGLGFGLALILVLGGPRVRHRLLAGMAAVAAAMALMVVIGGGIGAQSPLGPLVERGATLLDPNAVRSEESLRSRADETKIAWRTIKDHPLLGVGAGVDFGVFAREATGEGHFVRVPQLFLHNQYLYLLLVAGVPGLVCFLVFLVSTLRVAWARGRGDPVVVALGVGLATVMLSALVMIAFSYGNSAIGIGLVAGAIVAGSRARPTGQATAGGTLAPALLPTGERISASSSSGGLTRRAASESQRGPARAPIGAPARARVGAWAATALVGALAVGAGAVAILSDSERSIPDRARAGRVALAGQLAVSYPSSWERLDRPTDVPGLALDDPIALAPKGDDRGGGLLAGRVRGSVSALISRAESGANQAAGRPQPVRLGTLEAYRYTGLNPPAFDRSLTLYVVPTTAGVTAVVCFSEPFAARAFMPECERVATTLRLTGSRPVPVVLSRKLAEALDATVTRLNSARTTGARRLAAARTPAGQARIAAGLARAYERARRSLLIARGTTADPRSDGILAAIKASQTGYGRLAAAGRRRDLTAYDAARELIRRAEADLDRALRSRMLP